MQSPSAESCKASSNESGNDIAAKDNTRRKTWKEPSTGFQPFQWYGFALMYCAVRHKEGIDYNEGGLDIACHLQTRISVRPMLSIKDGTNARAAVVSGLYSIRSRSWSCKESTLQSYILRSSHNRSSVVECLNGLLYVHVWRLMRQNTPILSRRKDRLCTAAWG